MYYLIMSIFLTVNGTTSFSDVQWKMADKATCEIKRDAVLAAYSPVGKSGRTPNPYVTDAWCAEATEFDKVNHP